LRDVVDEVNTTRSAAAKQPIRVPVSALTVASRGHAECVDAESRPPVWRTYPNRLTPEATERPTDGALRFLAWLNRTALGLTAERAAISLAKYFHDDQ
jgi:hypothetical protein